MDRISAERSPGGYSAATYYRGEAAARYDEARTLSPFARRKWAAEESALSALLPGFEAGTSVLDMPCGTGRFDDLLTQRGHEILGVDISMDMLLAGGADALTDVPRVQADGTRLPLPDGAVSYAVCGRFLNLIPLPIVAEVLSELRRVVEGSAIVEVRVSRDRPVDRSVRLGNRLRNKVSNKLRGASGPSVAMPEREPIIVHPEAAFLRVLNASGWRETNRAEVIYTRMPVRPDPLLFLKLDPA